MMRTKRTVLKTTGFLLATALLLGCGDTDAQDPLPYVPPGEEENQEQPVDGYRVTEFYQVDSEGNKSGTEPRLRVIADSTAQIARPNDLAFHPHQDREFELWVINEGSNFQGGSTVTLFDAGSESQEARWIRDGNARHFMAKPPALAFGENGKWATSCGVQDANHQGGTFAGPSLWSSDFEIYGVVGDPPTSEVNGSHLDMLHGSPYSMGIAHERDNAYWVFDGYHGYIVRYDFQEPHYPGGYDHSDGLVHRYREVEIERHDSLPSHMILDKETGWLYINDTGNQRMLRLDTNTGEKLRDLALLNEPLEEHWEMHEVVFEVFIEGLNDPTGIAINGDRLFVSNHGTGEIIAFDLDTGEELDRIEVGEGVRGITIGPDDKLWLANYDNNQILRVDPR